MKLFKFLTLTSMLLFAFSAFALMQDPDITSPNYLVITLTPFIVLGVTFVFNKISPVIPGWATLLVVSAISALTAWASSALLNTDMSWLAQFGLGLASTFLHQLYKKFTE